MIFAPICDSLLNPFIRADCYANNVYTNRVESMSWSVWKGCEGNCTLKKDGRKHTNIDILQMSIGKNMALFYDMILVS